MKHFLEAKKSSTSSTVLVVAGGYDNVVQENVEYLKVKLQQSEASFDF